MNARTLCDLSSSINANQSYQTALITQKYSVVNAKCCVINAIGIEIEVGMTHSVVSKTLRGGHALRVL